MRHASIAIAMSIAAAAAAPGCGTNCADAEHPPCGDQTNATQATALAVSSVDGDSQNSAIPVSGVVDPGTGAAWYSYSASAGIFQTIDPEVYLHSTTTLRVCAYTDCSFGACPPGSSSSDVAPGGQAGCCAEGTDEHFQIYGCSSSSANVWMSVESLAPDSCNSCIGYELDYDW